MDFDELTRNFHDSLKLISVLTIATLVLGFFIWNLYLVQLGFYEFNLIQARFIHTGFVFLVSSFVILLIPIGAWINFSKKWLSFFISFLFVVWVIIYALVLFPKIPPEWGEAQPRVLSIIASERNIEYLSNFNIRKSSSVITENLCIAYENK